MVCAADDPHRGCCARLGKRSSLGCREAATQWESGRISSTVTGLRAATKREAFRAQTARGAIAGSTGDHALVLFACADS